MSKCTICKHYVLQYSPIYKTYVAGCDADISRKDGCKNAFEDKRPKKPIARIKRK